MNIEINYFDESFSIKKADFSKIKPFSHADVVVNCDQARCSMGGILERKVEQFLTDAVTLLGVQAKWDEMSEWSQLQQNKGNHLPRICKLGMGIDFII